MLDFKVGDEVIVTLEDCTEEYAKGVVYEVYSNHIKVDFNRPIFHLNGSRITLGPEKNLRIYFYDTYLFTDKNEHIKLVQLLHKKSSKITSRFTKFVKEKEL